MTSDIRTAINALVIKANSTPDSADAMRYAQAALNLSHAVSVLIEAGKDDEPEMVAAEPEDMNEALIEVANALDCECNLEDMLHAIDELRDRSLPLPPIPPAPTVIVRNGVPVNPEAR